MWLLVGVAVTVALYETRFFELSWSWGFVPMAVGIANLLFYVFTRRSETQR